MAQKHQKPTHKCTLEEVTTPWETCKKIVDGCFHWIVKVTQKEANYPVKISMCQSNMVIASNAIA